MVPLELMLSVGLGSGARVMQARARAGKVWPMGVRSNFKFREYAFLTTRLVVRNVYQCKCVCQKVCRLLFFRTQVTDVATL